MANVRWLGRAAAVKQRMTITIAGTYAATETVTLMMGDATYGRGLVVTVGSGSTTNANVATAIRDAIMADTRLTGVGGNTDATSNFGGREFGEFAEIEASIAAATPTVVDILVRKSGKPVTLTVTETSTSGTATLATPQAATGPNHWDNANNWDSGSVPANDDTVILENSSTSIWYGLPNGSREVTLNVYMSFTGQLGLPPINRDNGSLPYPEYRPRFARFDDAGTGTNIAHLFGLGDGPGSPLINVKHTVLPCSIVVYGTGQPLDGSLKALNIVCTVSTSTINVLSGHVDISSADSSTSAFATLRSEGSVRSLAGLAANADVIMSGGDLMISGTVALDDVSVYGGTLTFENQTGTIDLIYLSKGIVKYNSTATITLMTILANGDFDARSAVSTFNISAVTLYEGGRYRDPYQRINATLSWVGVPNTTDFPPQGSISFAAGGGGGGGA